MTAVDTFAADVAEHDEIESITPELPADALRLKVEYIAYARIHPDPEQPRREADDSLRASIATQGILQPITVRPIPHGIDGVCACCQRRWEELATLKHYVIKYGERRWRGAFSIMQHVPVIVRADELTPGRRLLGQIVENVARRELSPLDEARGYARALELDPTLSHAEIARQTGKSRSSITDRLALLKNAAWLPLLDDGEITVSQMIELSRYADRSEDEHARAIATMRQLVEEHETAIDICDIDVATFRTALVGAYTNDARPTESAPANPDAEIPTQEDAEMGTAPAGMGDPLSHDSAVSEEGERGEADASSELPDAGPDRAEDEVHESDASAPALPGFQNGEGLDAHAWVPEDGGVSPAPLDTGTSAANELDENTGSDPLVEDQVSGDPVGSQKNHPGLVDAAPTDDASVDETARRSAPLAAEERRAAGNTLESPPTVGALEGARAGHPGFFTALAAVIRDGVAMITYAFDPSQRERSYRVSISPAGKAKTKLGAPVSTTGTPAQLDDELAGALAALAAGETVAAPAPASAPAVEAVASKPPAVKAESKGKRARRKKPSVSRGDARAPKKPMGRGAQRKTVAKAAVKKASTPEASAPKTKAKKTKELFADAALAGVIGDQLASTPLTPLRATKLVLDYVKRQGLMGTGSERGLISCDVPLRTLFGKAIVKTTQIKKLLTSHLHKDRPDPADRSQLDAFTAPSTEDTE